MLGALFLLVAVLSTRHMTLSYDEDHFYEYGTQMVQLNSNRNNPSVMPIVALNALPKKAAKHIGEGTLHFLLSKFPAARMVTVLFGLALALVCFQWSRQLYGAAAGLFAMAMIVFEPNFLAHTRLVTTDLYVAFGFAISAYLSWRYSRNPGVGTLLALGIALGFANITKYSAVLLYPTVLALLVFAEVRELALAFKGGNWRGVPKIILAIAGKFTFLVAISLLVINIAFLINGTLTPLSAFEFNSAPFQSMQKSILQVANPPVPLPAPYLEGLDYVLYGERTAVGGVASFYLLGELNHTGFRGYYLIASLFKVPLGFQLLFLSALISYFLRKGWRGFLDNELFILLPLLVLTIYFNGINRFTKGIRHFLPAIPLAIVFTGSLFASWRELSKGKKAAALLAVIWGIASSLSYFPHFIPYFNELVLDRRFAYRILADSNLDWGQADWYLERYKEAHPEIAVAPDQPTPGLIVVGANELLGILGDPEDYSWLRDNFEPVDTIGYSYLVFDVSTEEIEALR